MSCLPQIRGILALLVLLCGAAAGAADNTHVLIVDLYINHQRVGETFVLQNEDGKFYVDEPALLYWEISKPWPDPHTFRGEKYYGIHQFSGATAELNTRSMELRVHMPADLMPTRRMGMQYEGFKARSERYGAFMDYDINLQNQSSSIGSSAYGMFRPVVFGPAGNIAADLIYRNESSGAVSNKLNVLGLTYTRDDPERMRSLRIGDVFTVPGEQSRSLRIGGVQLATNFATQPTLITHPLPDFFGQTDVPSALDIYVNGRLSRRENVQPGSYLLENVPVMNGSGQMQVVATDALGRQQIFSQDFYLSTDLLMQGLSDYSVTLGALREDFGLENFRYGDFAGTATWRYGFSDELTVESHGEFSGDVVMASGSVQYGIDAGGTISAGLGLSNNDEGTGARWQVGFRRIASPVHLNFQASGSTRKFDVVGNTQSVPKLQLLAATGKNLYDYGSVQLSVVHQAFHERSDRTIWSVDYSTRLFAPVSVSSYVSYLDADERDLSVGVRFFMNFGDRHSASGNVSNNQFGSSASARFQRNMPSDAGYGYHVAAGSSDNNFVDAGFAAQNQFGTYSFDVRNNESSGTAWQAGTRGSLAYMAGMTQFSRRIQDAFAVVKVGDIEGVRVYSENIEIGRTNQNGQIFVPGLRPYLKNQLRIEVDDLPLNARIGETERDTAPYYKSGVVVDFDVHLSTNVIFRAVRPDGTPLPEGAIASVFHTGDNFPVGMDGKLFLQGLDRSSEVAIRWNGTICDIDVPYPTGSAVIAKMGDIVCEPRKGQ
jgi:outer membrane usher protein